MPLALGIPVGYGYFCPCNWWLGVGYSIHIIVKV